MAIPWGPIVSGGLGLLGGIFGGGGKEQRTVEREQVPQWSPEQLPYLFGGSTWMPEQPLMNPYAVNYAGGLSAGYNPAFGPQQPMDFASLLGGGLGGAPGTPWFQDPGATPQAGGLAALLGIGAGGPPPVLMNAPQFGFGVANPELLHQQPGQSLVPSGPTPGEPQPQGAALGAGPSPMGRGYQDLFYAGSSPRYGPWWDQSRGQGTREFVEASRRRGQVLDRERALRGLQGRNVRDLTPEELALLGL